jgi:hypothetical protein
MLGIRLRDDLPGSSLINREINESIDREINQKLRQLCAFRQLENDLSTRLR